MGMKKTILHGMIWNLVGKGRRDPRWVKKIVALAVMFGLVFMLSFGFLLYFAVGLAKDLVADKPDMDLLAMERLITEKSLVLSEEQQRRLTPILEGLAAPGLAQEQARALKTQLLGLIAPAQLDKIESWKAKAKASSLFSLPLAVTAIIEQYAGISKEMVVARIEAFLPWWQLKKPENSAEQLQQTIETL